MAIKFWTKLGDPSVVAGGHGKYLINQKFRRPDGIEEDRFLFKGEKKSVVIFPVTSAGDLITIREYRHAINEIIYALPAGNIEPNETKESAVKRELLEETGFRADKIVVLREAGLWYDTGVFVATYYPCLALGCCPTGKQALDENESIEINVMNYKEWHDMILRGPVQDNQMIVTTFLAMTNLGLIRKAENV